MRAKKASDSKWNDGNLLHTVKNSYGGIWAIIKWIMTRVVSIFINLFSNNMRGEDDQKTLDEVLEKILGLGYITLYPYC